MTMAVRTRAEFELPAIGADVLVMLAAEHDAVDQLFERLRDASSHDERAVLAGRICRLIATHATCEEELLYPAASVILSDDWLIRAGNVEHAAARELMRRVEILSPSEPQFEPAVQVLREYVAHHAGEEEHAMFPRLRRSRLDLQSLGLAHAARRDELERLSGELLSQERDPAGTLPSDVAQAVAPGVRFDAVRPASRRPSHARPIARYPGPASVHGDAGLSAFSFRAPPTRRHLRENVRDPRKPGGQAA